MKQKGIQDEYSEVMPRQGEARLVDSGMLRSSHWISDHYSTFAPT